MKDWWVPFGNDWKPKANLKRSLLTEGMCQTVADAIQEAREAKNYKRADFLRDKLLAIGHWWDWEKYFEKVLPAYIFSEKEAKKINKNHISATMPQQRMVDKLRYEASKDGFKITGFIHEYETLKYIIDQTLGKAKETLDVHTAKTLTEDEIEAGEEEAMEE